MNIQSYINGLLTGVVIGVLFAPRSGADTRRRLSRGYKELRQSVNEGYEVTKHDLSNELKELTEEQQEMVRERALDIKNDIQASNT
jgi:gas vesicle protein